MTKDNYHHGDLKKEMIAKGLQLLNNEGYDGFSLRKVAVMCGVSHAAPYKHFKSKEELLGAIVYEVTQSFTQALQAAVVKYSDDPEKQIFELGKYYVKFMVENPDYMKFMFAGPHGYVGSLPPEDLCAVNSYTVFYNSAVNYLEWLGAKPQNRAVDILSMWCMVHGYAMLLVNKSIECPENYLDVIDKILRDKLKFD